MEQKELEKILDSQENLQKQFDELLHKEENPLLKDSIRLTAGAITLCCIAINNFAKLYLTIKKMAN